MKTLSLAILLLFINANVTIGQDSANLVRYTENFNFKRGVYKSYNEFRDNNPSITENYKIIIRNSDDPESSKKKDYIKFYKSPRFDVYYELYQGDAWGYTDGKKVYRFHGNVLFELHDIKAITRISCRINSSNFQKGSDNNYFMDQKSYNLNYIYDLENDEVYSEKKIKELDHVFKDNPTSINDPEVDEKKKNTTSYKIEQYNKENPIYFPINNSKEENLDLFIF